MTANDATMILLICIHIFLLKTPYRGFKISSYLKDYPTHEGANSHMASGHEYVLTS